MIAKKCYSLIPYGYNLFKIKAVIGGISKGEFQRVNLLVDTGASFTLISRKIVIDLGYDLTKSERKQRLITGKGITSPIPVIKVSWFNCAGKIVNDFDILAYDIPRDLKVDGVLGMNFLLKFKATISLGSCKIYFEE
jgi:aspartyl protease family protein